MVQSLSNARSLSKSARRRYFWGSVPKEEDASQANRIVAIRPVESWTTVSNTIVRGFRKKGGPAPVAVDVASPTPTPCSTARLASSSAA